MRDRDLTVYGLARLGLSMHHIDAVLRDLPAIQRGHEAMCSWPDEVAAPFVKRGDAAMKRVRVILTSCPAVQRVAEQGDPRGCVVEVYTKDEPGVHMRLCASGFTAAQVERIDAYARAKGGAS